MGIVLVSHCRIADIKAIVDVVKAKNPETICFVDNCYGEFTELQEPLEAGADIMAGSLIKNAGGGLAPTGGYIVGREDLVEDASYQLTAPGLVIIWLLCAWLPFILPRLLYGLLM